MKGVSIHSVMTAAIREGLDAEAAMARCRARLHLPKVSDKLLHEFYDTAKQCLARNKEVAA